jgi:hypothetical protein
MGVSLNSYLGPYIKIPIQEVDVKKVRYIDESSGKRVKTKFCPSTGVEFKEEIYTEKEKVTPRPYIDSRESNLDEDMFYSPAYSPSGDYSVCFMLNMNDPEVRVVIDDPDDSFEIDLSTGFSPNNYIEIFKRKYSDYIDYYKNKYGELEIKYGLLSYWS